MLVYSDGLIINLHVTEANYGDRKGLIDILNSLSPKFKDLKKSGVIWYVKVLIL